MSGTPDPTPTISGLYPTVNRAFISHHSYCALIESCDLRRLAFRLAGPVVTASSIPSVPMACGLFGFSLDNVFTTFWTMDIVLTRVLIQQCSSVSFHNKTLDSKVSDCFSTHDVIPKL